MLSRAAASWWLGELKALAPAWLTKRLPRAREPAFLYTGNGAWQLVRAGAEVIEIDASRGDDIVGRHLRSALGDEAAPLTLVLPRAAVLRRQLELPLLPDSSVRSAVELQVDRISPFNADGVRIAVRVIERDAAAGKLTADVAIVPRTPVEDLERRLAAIGLNASTIDVATGSGEREGFDLSADDPSHDGRRAWMATAGLTAAVVAMWAIVFYAWSAARESELASWQAAVAAIRPATERSLALQRQLAAIAEPLAVARMHKSDTALGDVLELTQLLGDDVRLFDIKFAGETIELTGIAADAPGLIAKLEASKRFKDVKFRSPVTRRPEMNKDRFEIVMTREGGS